MSRIAKKSLNVPEGISILIKEKKIILIKDNRKYVQLIPKYVLISCINRVLNFNVKFNNLKYWKYAGTIRSLLNNLIIGITVGFKKILKIIGIGYKAYVKDNKLFLNLGFSHIIIFDIPKYILIICNNLNEIIISGYNKQLVGQVAASIRLYHPPESYKKGKGIRYLNEVVRIKEHKKKVK